MHRLLLTLPLLIAVAPLAAAAPPIPAEGPVTITEDARAYTLKNDYLTATINKISGDIGSLIYKNLELMGHSSGHPAAYWEQIPSDAPRWTVLKSIDPGRNAGARAEVAIKGFSDGTPLGGAGQPGGAMLCDIEIRYCLGRSDHGLYAYAIYDHPATYGQTSIGESRFAAKLNAQVFDWLSIDAQRNHLMPSGYDWDHGTPLNMKEARRLTTGPFTGQAEHKYDYSAVQFDIPAFGWSSTKNKVGLFFINPTIEYLSGGATKVELTGHLDNGEGGDPTLLNYWRGSHYGSTSCTIRAMESWSRVIGPFLIYANSADTPDAMFKDALAQAKKEAAAWPYDWVAGVDYPLKADRSTVTGKLTLNDPLAPKRAPDGNPGLTASSPEKLSNLLVGLAYPDAPAPVPVATTTAPTTGRGRGRGFAPMFPATWQNDAKHYQFWSRGNPDGSFSIPNVREGTYQLHAIADGILGEFATGPIEIKKGKPLNLGTLEWKPVRYGKQLWEIGIPNRSGSEFFKGDDYAHWGMYLEYPKLFPDDVQFTIGKSDYRKDWFFEQVPHNTDPANTTGQGQGRASPWTINFTMDHAPKGKATLRLAIAGADGSITVAVNAQLAGTVNTGRTSTVSRDGIRGLWSERTLAFDAALLKQGDNTLVLTLPAGPLTSGIVYDYLRLELDESQ